MYHLKRCNTMSAQVGRAHCSFTKKKYNEYKKALEQKVTDAELIESILKTLCDTLNFDPTAKVYNEQVAKRNKEWQKKKAEELGISVYEVSGGKAHYARKKEAAQNVPKTT